MIYYDVIVELMNYYEIICKISNQAISETSHDNLVRFSASVLPNKHLKICPKLLLHKYPCHPFINEEKDMH